MRRLLLRPTAELDAEAVFAFLVERNPRVAQRYIDSLRTTLESVRRMPQAGMHVRVEAPQLEGVHWRRVDGFANHLIFYRWGDDFIEVLRILHAAQDWAAKLGD